MSDKNKLVEFLDMFLVDCDRNTNTQTEHFYMFITKYELIKLKEIRRIIEQLRPVVDKEIQSLVNALNKGGCETVASCSGHGRRLGNIALRDGRWILIIENHGEWEKLEKALTAVGCLPINAPLPDLSPDNDLVEKILGVVHDMKVRDIKTEIRKLLQGRQPEIKQGD